MQYNASIYIDSILELLCRNTVRICDRAVVLGYYRLAYYLLIVLIRRSTISFFGLFIAVEFIGWTNIRAYVQGGVATI
jgi:hypothetical protein